MLLGTACRRSCPRRSTQLTPHGHVRTQKQLRHRVCRRTIGIERRFPSTGARCLDDPTLAPPLKRRHTRMLPLQTRQHPSDPEGCILTRICRVSPHLLVPQKWAVSSSTTQKLLFIDVARTCRVSVAALATKEEHEEYR